MALSIKSTNIKGSCDYCPMTMCNTCLMNNKFCHGNDNGRSICSMHKTIKLLTISSNRIAVSKGGLKGNYQPLFTEFVYYKNSLKTSNLFHSFYTEFHVILLI